ncbi:mCG1038747, partial [Mus musculus]
KGCFRVFLWPRSTLDLYLRHICLGKSHPRNLIYKLAQRRPWSRPCAHLILTLCSQGWHGLAIENSQNIKSNCYPHVY